MFNRFIAAALMLSVTAIVVCFPVYPEAVRFFASMSFMFAAVNCIYQD